MSPPVRMYQSLRARVAFRETEIRGRELEGQLQLCESRVPAARSELEEQQRTARDRRQQERDRVHAQLQEEAHRRQVSLDYRVVTFSPLALSFGCVVSR